MTDKLPTAEERARSVCVILKAVRRGLPRKHTENCGECKRVAGQIRAAVEAEQKKWDTEEGLSVDCPICQRRVGQKCVIYIKNNISISAGPDRVEVHSHRQRIAAAIRAGKRRTKNETSMCNHYSVESRHPCSCRCLISSRTCRCKF